MRDAAPQSKLTLRSVPADVARAQSALSRVIEPLPLTAKGAQIVATLDAPRGEGGAAAWLSLSLDGAPLALRLSWGQAREAAGTLLEGIDGGDAALLLEDALAPWIEEVEGTLGLALRLISIGTEAPALPVRTTLNLQGRTPAKTFVQSRMPARLSLEAAAILADALGSRQARRAAPRQMRLNVYVEYTDFLIGTADLRSLSPGDAIEIPADHAPRLLIERSLTAPAMADGPGRFRLDGPFRAVPTLSDRGYAPMHDEPQTDAAPDSALDEARLDEVSLALSFRAGTATMDIGALRGLAPGAIIETTEDAGAQVEILVNGRAVGTGELIEVAGRRAVQVRTLFAGG